MDIIREYQDIIDMLSSVAGQPHNALLVEKAGQMAAEAQVKAFVFNLINEGLDDLLFSLPQVTEKPETLSEYLGGMAMLVETLPEAHPLKEPIQGILGYGQSARIFTRRPPWNKVWFCPKCVWRGISNGTVVGDAQSVRCPDCDTPVLPLRVRDEPVAAYEGMLANYVEEGYFQSGIHTFEHLGQHMSTERHDVISTTFQDLLFLQLAERVTDGKREGLILPVRKRAELMRKHNLVEVWLETAPHWRHRIAHEMDLVSEAERERLQGQGK